MRAGAVVVALPHRVRMARLPAATRDTRFHTGLAPDAPPIAAHRRHKVRIRRHVDRALAFSCKSSKEKAAGLVVSRLQYQTSLGRSSVSSSRRMRPSMPAPCAPARQPSWFLLVPPWLAPCSTSGTFDWNVHSTVDAVVTSPAWRSSSQATPVFPAFSRRREFPRGMRTSANTASANTAWRRAGLTGVRGNRFKPTLRLLEVAQACSETQLRMPWCARATRPLSAGRRPSVFAARFVGCSPPHLTEAATTSSITCSSGDVLTGVLREQRADLNWLRAWPVRRLRQFRATAPRPSRCAT